MNIYLNTANVKDIKDAMTHDVGADGMNLIRQIITIYHNYDFKTEVFVASVRHPVHVVETALAGGDSCTMPYSVYQHYLGIP